MGIVNQDGALFLATGIDNSGLEKGLRDAASKIEDFGKNAEKAGDVFAKSFDIKDQIEIQKKVITELENEYKKAKTEFEKVNIGTQDPQLIAKRVEASKLFKQVKTELDSEKKGLQELELQEKQLNREREKATVSYLTQMNKIKQQMQELLMENKSDTPKYKELEKELINIGTAYKKIQQEQKNLTTAGSATISGLLSGMSAVSGAFSAGSGVMSLFVKDNEKLAAIQTKLQAAMAITIGLQQVSTTLHSTSAFRMNVVTKITNTFAVANTRLAVGLGISTVAAKALMAALTLGLSIAITGIIYLIDKFATEQSKAREEILKFNEGVASSANTLRTSFEKLRKEWSLAGDDLKKKEKLILTNSDAYDKLGVSINNVEDADRVFRDHAEEFVKSIELRAKATAAMDIASEKYKESIQKMLDAEKRVENPTGWDKTKGFMSWFGSQQAGNRSNRSWDDMTKDWAKKGAEEDKAEAEKQEKETIQLIAKSLGWSDEANSLLDNLGIKSKENLKEGTKAWYQEFQKNRQKAIDGLTKDELSSATGKKLIKERDVAAKILQNWNKTPTSSTIIKKTEYTDYLKLENDKIKAQLEYRSSFLENQQKLLDLEDDSFEKKQKQIELNHQKELLTIEKNAQELIKKRQQEEYKQWKLDNPNTKKTFKTTIKTVLDLSKDDQNLLSDSTVIADKTRRKANEDLLKSLLSKYQDYAEQRELIEKQFNEDISALEKSRTQENSKQIDIALSEASKKKKEALSSINMDELRNSIDWQKVFGDLDRVSADTIKNLKDKLKTYIQEAGNNLSPVDLKALTEAITQLEQKYAQLKPNKAFTESFDEYKEATENVKKLKKELDEIKKGREVIIGIDYNKETGKMTPVLKSVEQAENSLTEAQEKRRLAMYKLSEAMDGYNDRIQKYIGLARSVIDTFSDFGIEVPEGMQMMVDGISKVSEGVADFSEGLKSGNPVQMIQGGVKALGGIAKTVKGLFGGNVNKEHREALKLLEAQRKQLQHIVALEKLREDLNYKQGETVFGSDKWGKARNGAVNYAKSVKELQKSLQDLEDVDVVTGSKKSGWGPWKKRKDVWSDLLSAYPELIDANGEFDKTLAQTILTTQKLDDEGKVAIQNAIDNAELVEEAYAVMKDQLTDIFGNLGGSITDAFVDAFRNGTGAAKTATDNIGKMLEDLIAQMVYSLTLGPLMEEYSDKMMEISSNKNLTDKEKLDGYINTIGTLMDDAMAQQDLANELLGYAQDKAKEQGIEIFKPDSSSTSQDSTKGYSTSMTQDQAGEISGRMTGIYETNLRTEDNTAELVLLVSQNNATLKGFESNFKDIRDIGLQSMYHLQDINKNTQQLYLVHDLLVAIEKNTKGLVR